MLNLVDQPDDVVAVFQRAVAIDPDDRFSGCRDLALAVRAVLDAHGVQLDLDDLQADLATEVDEDRAQKQAETQRRQASEEVAVDAEAPTELDPARSTPGPAPGKEEALGAQDTNLEPPVTRPRTAATADTAAPAPVPTPASGVGAVPLIAVVGTVIAFLVMALVIFYGWPG
jgi:hypothetical protein